LILAEEGRAQPEGCATGAGWLRIKVCRRFLFV
jgi:hypothetical protein